MELFLMINCHGFLTFPNQNSSKNRILTKKTFHLLPKLCFQLSIYRLANCNAPLLFFCDKYHICIKLEIKYCYDTLYDNYQLVMSSLINDCRVGWHVVFIME